MGHGEERERVLSVGMRTSVAWWKEINSETVIPAHVHFGTVNAQRRASHPAPRQAGWGFTGSDIHTFRRVRLPPSPLHSLLVGCRLRPGGGLPTAFRVLCACKAEGAHCVFAQQSSSGDVLIRNVQLKHSGQYVCVVQSGVDSVSTAAALVVRGNHPRAPASFRFHVLPEPPCAGNSGMRGGGMGARRF